MKKMKKRIVLKNAELVIKLRPRLMKEERGEVLKIILDNLECECIREKHTRTISVDLSCLNQEEFELFLGRAEAMPDVEQAYLKIPVENLRFSDR